MSDRISYDDRGRLDEVVVGSAASFHLEYMSDRQVWMRIVTKGKRPDVVVVLTAKGSISGTVQED